MNKVQKIIEAIKTGDISEQDAVKKIGDWLEQSYKIGLDAGMARQNKWYSLCEPCGLYLFPFADTERLAKKQTLIHNNCPRCKNKAFLYLVGDWLYASGLPSLTD